MTPSKKITTSQKEGTMARWLEHHLTHHTHHTPHTTHTPHTAHHTPLLTLEREQEYDRLTHWQQRRVRVSRAVFNTVGTTPKLK
jgi:hypothetical protein